MTLTLESLLRAVFPAFDPAQTKLHLAQWNSLDHPLDVFEAGHFDLWQAAQNNRNFSRAYVATLIQTPRRDIWRFAGLWAVAGDAVRGPAPYETHLGTPAPDVYVYTLHPVPEVQPIIGRLDIRFTKTFRNNYPYFETAGPNLMVHTLVDGARTAPRFRGYRSVRLRWPQLVRILNDLPEDWATALAAVSAVYLITTPSGHHYVGSAYGVHGLLGRWQAYVAPGGHGGNVGLQSHIQQHPEARDRLQFSVLETLDLGTSMEDMLDRERHWKLCLGSRATGLNLN